MSHLISLKARGASREPKALSLLIKGITSDHDLIELAKRIGVKLDGILAVQEITKPLPKTGSYLILLRHDSSVGHWTAVYDNTYFDSMGIGPFTVLGDLKYSKIQFQSTYGEYCGIWSLFWLYCKQKNRMDLMKGFTNLDTYDVI